ILSLQIQSFDCFFDNIYVHSNKISGICEAQETCMNCGDDRFSYYKCNASHDCLADEICTGQGFCCPATELSRTVSSLFSDNFGMCPFESTYKFFQFF
ncbi:unnamed protein product, partial [Brugia timori]|uniref:Disintegrin domain-containing protein n=1 Tax=Brugia timori TaxID=42155 RepID=A0A0R3R335_9BILA